MKQIDLNLDVYRQLIDSVSELRHIELQGEGESLLHPHFFAMIDYARRRFPRVRISFVTNGSLFTQDNITNILNASIDSMLVSIESADAGEFQAIRGGKFDRVKRGISELLRQKQAADSKMTVGFAVTILKRTIGQITQIGALYQELGMDGGITVQPLQTMDCYSQHYSDELKQNIPNGTDQAAMTQLIASDSVTGDAIRAFAQTPNFYTDLYTSVPPKTPTCPWLENALYLSADGSVNSCVFIKNSARDGLALFNNNLAELLDKRRRLLENLRSGVIPGQCQGCKTAHRAQHLQRGRPSLYLKVVS
jgi:MoaA/NifB/PqqE/SkfB family radical SAM enzyme